MTFTLTSTTGEELNIFCLIIVFVDLIRRVASATFMGGYPTTSSSLTRRCESFSSAFPSARSCVFDFIISNNQGKIMGIDCSFWWCTQLFTNSDQRHATRVLQRLGIEDCFQRIICFETMNPHLFEDATRCSKSPVILKPSAAAMEMAVRLAGAPSHGKQPIPLCSFDILDCAIKPPLSLPCQLFLDDNERNIAAGKAVGLSEPPR